MDGGKLKWKAIRDLEWTEELYNGTRAWVANGKPKGKYGLPNVVKDSPFALNEAEELILIDPNVPPWAVKGDKQVILVELPVVYKVIPRSKVFAYLNAYWTNPALGGFRGRDSMYNKLKRTTIGIQQKDVVDFLNNQSTQEVLQRRAGDRIKVVKPILTTFPHQHWEVDLIDMSFISNKADNRGYNYILMCVDLFSKFLWLRPIKKKEAAITAEAMHSIFMQGFIPKKVTHDNGTEWRGQFNEQLVMYGISYGGSLGYKPSTQGAVERLNGTLKSALQKYWYENTT